VKDLIWLGDSRAIVQSFPKEVKRDVGFSLNYAQLGHKAENSKPFKGFPGVFEISVPFMKDAYRAVYALKIGDRIYVLHAFKKKSKSGIKTPQREVELIRARFKDAKRMEEENV
jgi:phage-related protein